jgi:hypothetical protein
VAYEHEGYSLHARTVQLKGGHEQTIYFFSKRRPQVGEPVDLPAGYDVSMNRRTGLPYLRKRA